MSHQWPLGSPRCRPAGGDGADLTEDSGACCYLLPRRRYWLGRVVSSVELPPVALVSSVEVALVALVSSVEAALVSSVEVALVSMPEWAEAGG